ncbi:hypothetical protein QR680_009257 [Steinernema hermaphroditum]|uniref:CCHC-type domain-containing protein n=1 Tax=Steinernema hermaphroditum TaxID=289476 RepID=A0AA39M9K1_9BILA|nr:hypothetical protein QR680_009257 [Steinernema hermaphroditum]
MRNAELHRHDSPREAITTMAVHSTPKVQNERRNGQHSRANPTSQRTATPTAQSESFCAFYHGGQHTTETCRAFSTPEDRRTRAKDLKACFRCLKTGHDARRCRNQEEMLPLRPQPSHPLSLVSLAASTSKKPHIKTQIDLILQDWLDRDIIEVITSLPEEDASPAPRLTAAAITVPEPISLPLDLDRFSSLDKVINIVLLVLLAIYKFSKARLAHPPEQPSDSSYATSKKSIRHLMLT